MSHLVLIRGLPGSGKSTLAKAFIGYKHVEADQFFTVNGEYGFDRSRINEAHQWCQDTTEAYLKQYHSVVVSNTFTQLWEMQPYKDMAFRLHASFAIVEAGGDFPNIHGVPEETIESMRRRWERL